jgi:purine-cytosine permease-like protein
MLAILVLVGSAGKSFDTSAVSVGPAGTFTANRCSFFALEFASVIGFAAIGADFYVYYPTATPKWITFLTTWSGIWLALIFCNIVGVGIATGVATNPAWNDAYGISSGALLLACYDGLGGFGGFCVVILALGSITNNAPCTYAAALTIQALGRYAKAIPRWIWCVVITLIELVCSVAGRNHLFRIFENFLPIMSYWVCPWITIALEEHLLFHVLKGVPFDWTAWEDKKKLPIGAAALSAWLVGWAGAIIGMYQIWYQGPIALKIGGYGGDIGAWMSIAFAGVTYPPLRYVELKKFGR